MFLSVHFSLFDTLTHTLAKKLFNRIEFAHRYWNPKIRNVVLLVSENVHFLRSQPDTHHQNIKSWTGVLFSHLTNQSLINWTSQPFYDTSVASAGSNILNN
jgi:hypothetical protein